MYLDIGRETSRFKVDNKCKWKFWSGFHLSVKRYLVLCQLSYMHDWLKELAWKPALRMVYFEICFRKAHGRAREGEPAMVLVRFEFCLLSA